jgi:GNAT superfamily N-acetyltransferase
MSTDTAVTVVSGQSANPRTLGRTIAWAFFDLAPSHYLVPDPRTRAVVFPESFALDVEDTQQYGTVYTIEGLQAVALWMGHSGLDEPLEPDPRLDRVAGRHAPRFRDFYATLHQRHPTGRPFHHLMILAVAREHQGQGIGTRLLTAHHDYLDAIGMPGYLEAASPRLREIYRRFGYEEHGDPIILPDGVTPMYPMLREPRGEQHS